MRLSNYTNFIIVFFLLFIACPVHAEESLELEIEYADDAENVLFTITPSTDRACIYNFYAQQRKKRLNKLPGGAPSIATFQWEGKVALRAFNLEPIKKPLEKLNHRFRRNVFFRIMLRCDGYEGERNFSSIYKLRLNTSTESGLKSVKAWIQRAKYNIDYANDTL
ncbi:MAG: hypothetical protein KDD56_07985 [Bdellovibrionales bacterium]|nr:hypothetical protein [Bdellovibrionales bacterium]